MLGLVPDKAESQKGFLSNLLGIKAGETTDKFSLLLKSFSIGQADSKALGKKFLFDKIEASDVKEPSAIGLLMKTDAKAKPSTSPLLKLFNIGKEGASEEELIHSDIIKALPANGLKQNIQNLIGEAKDYLKDQISKKIDIKELPKTLGGLIKLAEKSGIDVRAISFESLSNSAFKDELSQVLKIQKQPEASLLSHSTSQLVKPIVSTEKEPIKPLNALLSKKFDKVEATEAKEIFVKPAAKTPLAESSLNALLHGEEVETEEIKTEVHSKIDIEKPANINQTKTEQLSSKITEAKQLVQHVAQSIRESVENYKPPFTRIKMQLNPQKFGEMDITMVQRGNNVHININANTTALTVMMQNSHELKAALSAHGLGDASMNFSSHQQQQNEKHKHENAQLSYKEYQDFEEEFSEIATALEVVVPRYI